MNTRNNRLSVRSVGSVETYRLRHLSTTTRLPQGALLEDAINLLWEEYVEDGTVTDADIRPAQ